MSIVSSWSEIIVLRGCRRWREEAVEEVPRVEDNPVQELLISGFALVLERRQVRRAEAAADAAAEEGVDSLPVGRVGEPPPSSSRVHQLGDRPV